MRMIEPLREGVRRLEEDLEFLTHNPFAWPGRDWDTCHRDLLKARAALNGAEETELHRMKKEAKQ